ncbi:hypothetical protein GJ496_011099 [Pomphorhynchus laevis]|nr:hypothetical protein GJ496_011099 [Pomphorhynchus laevis]
MLPSSNAANFKNMHKFRTRHERKTKEHNHSVEHQNAKMRTKQNRIRSSFLSNAGNKPESCKAVNLIDKVSTSKTRISKRRHRDSNKYMNRQKNTAALHSTLLSDINDDIPHISQQLGKSFVDANAQLVNDNSDNIVKQKTKLCSPSVNFNSDQDSGDAVTAGCSIAQNFDQNSTQNSSQKNGQEKFIVNSRLTLPSDNIKHTSTYTNIISDENLVKKVVSRHADGVTKSSVSNILLRSDNKTSGCNNLKGKKDKNESDIHLTVLNAAVTNDDNYMKPGDLDEMSSALPKYVNKRDGNQPLYVNAKQYHRILKRRETRAKLELEGRIPRCRKKFMHRSRHVHALNRIRSKGGRFAPGSRKQPNNRGDTNSKSMSDYVFGADRMTLNSLLHLGGPNSGNVVAIQFPNQITSNMHLFKCDPYPSGINIANVSTGSYNKNNYRFSYTSITNSQIPVLQKKISNDVNNKQQCRPSSMTIHENGRSSTDFEDK